jgi:hypothetical protein
LVACTTDAQQPFLLCTLAKQLVQAPREPGPVETTGSYVSREPGSSGTVLRA